MAIVKNTSASRLYGDSSPQSRDSVMSDDEEFQSRSSASKSDSDDDNDVDSGMDSDGFDLSELGEIGEEFCQLGSQKCSIPFELYDLPDLSTILSLDTWNNCLTDDERFRLTEYLPDLDQETFGRTLRELFSGSNFYFGSPLTKVFDRLKGGLCEPRVALYQQGLNFFQKCEHYHLLRNYQNSMVGSLIQIRNAWENCLGYGIEEKLRVLNILRSQRGSTNAKEKVLESDMDSSAGEESFEGLWGNRIKDNKVRAKRSPVVYAVRPSADVSSRGTSMKLEHAKYGKQNPKGILRVTKPKASSEEYIEAVTRFPSSNHGLKMKSRPSISMLAQPAHHQSVGYDSGTACGRSQMRSDDDEEEELTYKFGLRSRNQNVRSGYKAAKVGLVKPGKKQEYLNKYDTDVHIGIPFSETKQNLNPHGKSRDSKKMTDREQLTGKLIKGTPVYDYRSPDDGKKVKYPEKVKRSLVKVRNDPSEEQIQRLVSKGIPVDQSAGSEPFRRSRPHEGTLVMDHSVKLDKWNVKHKKWKKGGEFPLTKNGVGPDSRDRSYNTVSPHMDDPYLHSDHTANLSKEKGRREYVQNGGMDMEDLRENSMYSQSEETESDSSEQFDEGDDMNHTISKLAYLSGGHEVGRSASARLGDNPRKGSKLLRKDREQGQILNGVKYNSLKMVDQGKQLLVPEIKIPSKGKQKNKMSELSHMHDYGTNNVESKNFSAPTKPVDEHKQTFKAIKNGRMQGGASASSQLPVLKTYRPEKKRKGKVGVEYSEPQANYECGNSVMEEELFHVEPDLVDEPVPTNRSEKKGQTVEAHLSKSERQLLVGCNSTIQKQKGKPNLKSVDMPDESGPHQPVHDPDFAKKRGKRKAESETMLPADAVVSEQAIMSLDAETKLQKKRFTLITPSIHTGFSFSVVHLLSAVRMAMITLNSDDSLEVGKHFDKSYGRQKPEKEEENRKPEGVNGVSFDLNSSEQMGQKHLPSLTVQEIVNRVRSNPGDPCILETQEPLQDLIRGVLKIFSSKTAPLGAKGWKPLVSYDKSTKSWSWIGPISSSSSDHEIIEEETSPDAWGVPYKMLVKLVDAFANWLKSGQETLQQIGSLPAPPMSLMLPNMDEKERFRDLRAQKSLTTITPSSDEVRAYFRREEVLRYSVPDRAFSYTAADGRKSIVAPLRRCGGKPTSKARDHFMLKPDRPPHVTILCLVRDAAARLPGSIGTRADVCTLIRDSQYIVEDVSDAQVNQVVSGALDRLHYERDPCVMFDGERKLWVYLHRDREEEDFEDDGTSSTKKWKRPRKDGGTELPDPGSINDVSHQGTADQTTGGGAATFDFTCDLNVESADLVYNDLRPNIEDNMEPFIETAENMREGHPMGWEVLDMNPSRENKILCLENSTNEDFDDETFSKERLAG